MIEVLVLIAVIIAVIGVVALMIRGVLGMWHDQEHSGSVSSGVAGALTELDRVARPSVEHVIKAKNAVIKQVDNIGGD